MNPIGGLPQSMGPLTYTDGHGANGSVQSGPTAAPESVATDVMGISGAMGSSAVGDGEEDTNMTPTTPASTASTPQLPERRFELPAEHELRFEVPREVTSATLTLLDGAAEIFGIELAVNRAYPLTPGWKAAAFTWHGATLSLQAVQTVMAYTATGTPMPAYLRAHHSLQVRRSLAGKAGLPGPRAVIVGPRDVGKTTLVSLLVAYCVKANELAIVVDIDPSGSGAAGLVPGSFGLSLVTHLDLEIGGLVHEKSQTVFVGHTAPRDNVAVTQAALDAMGRVVDAVVSTKDMHGEVGVLVDTSGDVDSSESVDAMVHAVTALRADVVFVLDAERLHAALSSRLQGTATETVLLEKSGGVVSRDEGGRMEIRDQRIKEYFYGVEKELSPFSTTVEFEKVVIVKVGGVAGVVPDSALPVGAESSLDPLKPTRVARVDEVLHRVLGVSAAEREEDAMRTPVLGFVHVVSVNSERGTMMVLAPSPGRLPNNLLLAGDVKWIE